VLSCLSLRERLILYLRFYQGLSQAEVAKRLHISQMHVSRLEHRALERVRQIGRQG
jgi:RNA polymerase sigma-B factor